MHHRREGQLRALHPRARNRARACGQRVDSHSSLHLAVLGLCELQLHLRVKPLE